MNIAIFSLTFAAIAWLLGMVLRRLDLRIGIAGVFLFALYLGLDDLATSLSSVKPSFDWAGGNWNWSGKTYSLMLSVLVLFALRIRLDAAGLTWRVKNLRTSCVALVVLTLFSLTLGFVFKPGVPSLETMAFQALMPGLAEEIAYRGIAPAILLGWIFGKPMSFPQSPTTLAPAPSGTPWMVVIVTGVMFGLWHSLSFRHGAFAFDMMSGLFPLIGGIAYGWLRFHSGSVLFPIIAHSLGNLAFALTGFMS